MTNIQAINLLKGLWQSLDDYCELNDEGKAAFCMAIEALSCSEIPNSSDTISREAAVDALDKRFDSIPMEQTTDILLLRKDLRELPSAQPATSCSEIPNGSDDTISRQAAIDALRVAYWDDNIQSAKDDPCIVDAMTDWAIRQVKALPSAQSEIIRCKDCKYRDENWRRVSVRWLPCMDVRTGSNWYCGSAERCEQDE